MNHGDLRKALEDHVKRIEDPGNIYLTYWDRGGLPKQVNDCLVSTTRVEIHGSTVTFLDVFKGRNGEYDPVYVGVVYENTSRARGVNPRVVDVNMIHTIRETFKPAGSS